MTLRWYAAPQLGPSSNQGTQSQSGPQPSQTPGQRRSRHSWAIPPGSHQPKPYAQPKLSPPRHPPLLPHPLDGRTHSTTTTATAGSHERNPARTVSRLFGGDTRHTNTYHPSFIEDRSIGRTGMQPLSGLSSSSNGHLRLSQLRQLRVARQQGRGPQAGRHGHRPQPSIRQS